LLIAVPAFAQTAVITTPYTSTTPSCANITQALWYGKYDTTTDGQVSVLQNFLHAEGYLSVSATGYFGPLTLQATKDFQGAVGLQADGIVGVQTQAHIRADSCPVTTTPATAPIISAITPTAGATGTMVTITGSGFTDSNIVHFSIGAVSTVASSNNGTTLTFTVPGSIGPYCKPDQACPMYMELLNAGTYPISIENNNGTSNTMSFTITNNATQIPN